MCWSRKGVPGSKRSGEAGTPFLGPAAEPNFGSERAAGSSDRGPPHERRPNGPPIRRPAAGEPAITRTSLSRAFSRSTPRDEQSLQRATAGRTRSRRGSQTAGCVAKRRRQARRSPHRPVTGEDLLAAGKEDPLPGRVGVFVRARVLAGRSRRRRSRLPSRSDDSAGPHLRSGRSRPVRSRVRRRVPFASRRAASGHSGAGDRSACGGVRCGRTRSAPPRSPRPSSPISVASGSR